MNLKYRFPYASAEFLALNHPSPGPKSEHPVRHKPLGKARREKSNAARCLVRITSFRRILLDRDNLCAKFFVDSLRYAGAISDDSEEAILFQISQKKVAKEEEECTLIEVIYK